MKTFFSAILVSVVALAMSGVAQAVTIYADARADFKAAGTEGQTTQTATANPLGLTDTFGAGYWNYYSNTTQYGVPPSTTLLTWKHTGDSSWVPPAVTPSAYNLGYGGTGTFGTAAISTARIFPDGLAPSATELVWVPSDTGADAVLTWTAGAAEATNALNISGTFTRDVVNTGSGTGGYLTVYVNGVQQYQLKVEGSDVTQHTYSLSGLSIAAGQTVDITYDWGGNWASDEARMSATISGTPIPEPGTLALLAAGLVGLLAYAWKKRK